MHGRQYWRALLMLAAASGLLIVADVRAQTFSPAAAATNAPNGLSLSAFAPSLKTSVVVPVTAAMPASTTTPVGMPTSAVVPASQPTPASVTIAQTAYNPAAAPAPRTYDSNRFAASLGAPPPDVVGPTSTGAGSTGYLPASASLEHEASLASALEAPAAPKWYEIGSDKSLKGAWNHGLEFESPNKDFRVHVGGQIQFDAGFFSPNHGLEVSQATGGLGQHFADSVNFRRARLRVDGTMYEVIDWVAMYDFSNLVETTGVAGSQPGAAAAAGQNLAAVPQGAFVSNLAIVPSFTEVYMSITKMPIIGNFRVGNFREPLGFDHLVSSRFLDFMERSFNQEAFYSPFNNSFMPGMMLHNWTENERATWALWAGPNQSNIFGYHLGDQYAGTMRLTWLPYYNTEGRYLLHVGTSLSNRRPDQGQARFRTRGPIRSGPPNLFNLNYADTFSFDADNQALANFELAGVWGPFNFQAEWCGTWLSNTSVNPLLAGAVPAAQAGGIPTSTFFHGGYVEMMYFLTGEHRAYNRRTAVFDRVVPNENFAWVRTPRGSCFTRGAWQTGVRYSGLSLNDQTLNGGILNSVTFGLNWFLNPNVKYQWNYDLTSRSQVGTVPATLINSFGMRMAMDF